MKAFPHVYPVTAQLSAAGSSVIRAEGLPDLPSAAPKEFDGPGDQWSPESLLIGAVASCFLLTFKAVARASKLDWQELECAVEGTLDRKEGVTQFTHIRTHAKLTVGAGIARDLCVRVLEKSEHSCLVVNSLRAERALTIDIVQV